MNSKAKVILGIGVLAALLLSAGLLYDRLSGQYAPNPEEKSISEPSVGEKQAADFTVYDAQGEPITLSGQFGKPIVVNFWASWCGACKMGMPAFEALFTEFGENVQFLMVNLTGEDRVKAAEEFIQTNGYTFPVYFDKDKSAATAYRITGVPLTVFIDADGVISDSYLGAMEEDALRGYIETIKGEKTNG